MNRMRKFFLILLPFSMAIYLLCCSTDVPYFSIAGRNFIAQKKHEGIRGMSMPNQVVPRRIVGPSYIPVINNTVYINSAMLGNSTSKSSWDRIILTIWSKEVKHDKRCCAFYRNGDVISTAIVEVVNNVWASPVKGRLVQCLTPLTRHQELPIAASLIKNGENCPTNESLYYPLEMVYQQTKGSIGICTKTAYGTLNASMLIEWFEIHRFLGVDKVYTQIDPSLNQEARKVFSFYESMDFLTTKQFDQPDIVRVNLEVKTRQAFSQGWFAIQDCAEHLRGYTYIIVYDFDEFLIPNGNRSWKEMVDGLFDSKPNAYGFCFKSSIIVTSFGMTTPNNSMFLTRYLKRSIPYFDRVKIIYRPERIYRGATTHYMRPKPGYRKYDCPTDVGFIRHIRKFCRDVNRLPNDPCFDVTRRVEDNTIVEFAARVENITRNTKHKLLGT